MVLLMFSGLRWVLVCRTCFGEPPPQLNLVVRWYRTHVSYHVRHGDILTMDNELIHRIRRIYAAISAAEEADFSKLKATIIKTDKHIAFYQDFRGGLSNEELSNLAHSVIHNIANLRDHLRRWAARNGRDRNKVDEAVNRSLALQIIKDLSNNDKHGYPPRGGGHSGQSPRLVGVERVFRLITKPESGSYVTMTLGHDGAPKVSGSGSAKAVITGDVVDEDNNTIGYLHEIAVEAVEAWERLLSDFNVTLQM